MPKRTRLDLLVVARGLTESREKARALILAGQVLVNGQKADKAGTTVATAANPGAPGYGVVMQGYTEASNVDAVSEITNLIVAQRAYEMNSKVVTTADQMLSTAVNTQS